jgi:hypothetical protein
MKVALEECSWKNRRATRQISHACCKSEEHARKLWRGRCLQYSARRQKKNPALKQKAKKYDKKI